jgi:hypothetical protein
MSMHFTAKVLLVDRNTFTFWQMYPAVRTSHHILSRRGRTFITGIFFRRLPTVILQQQEDNNANNNYGQ